jgi:hypothetical protein
LGSNDSASFLKPEGFIAGWAENCAWIKSPCMPTVERNNLSPRTVARKILETTIYTNTLDGSHAYEKSP